MLRKLIAINFIGLFGVVMGAVILSLVVAGWLPSGDQVVYMGNLNAQYDLFVTDLRTHHTLQLTYGESQNSRYPAWSPDGRYIAYHGNIDQHHGIFIMDTQTGAVEWLDFGLDDLGDVYDEAMVNWSPDGKRITFHRGNSEAGYAIYIADMTGENVIRLTESGRQDLHAYWSPDGEKIAYSHHPQGESGVIYILDVEDAINGVDNIGQALTSGIFPAWSPDGSTLAYADNTETGAYQIYVIDLETGEQRQLTGGQRATQNTMPDWSPDGEWIVFSSNRRLTYGIYRIRRDGTDTQQISIPLTHISLEAPAYRP
jgi:TolB protein